MYNTINYAVVYTRLRLLQTKFENRIGVSTQICKTECKAILLRDQYRQIWGEENAEYYELNTLYGDDGTFSAHYRGFNITGDAKTKSVATLIDSDGRSFKMKHIRTLNQALDYVNSMLRCFGDLVSS